MGKQDVAKVIEIVGSSEKSWADAADKAVRSALIKGTESGEVSGINQRTGDKRLVAL